VLWNYHGTILEPKRKSVPEKTLKKMKTDIRKLNNSEIEILFEISWNEFLPFYERAVLELGENLTVPGFRPGKAPKETLIGRIGGQKIMMKAAESAINEFYQNHIEKEKLEIIDIPEIEITKLAPSNPFCFKAKIRVFPEIILPDYKKIASGFKKNPVLVEEKEIDEGLTWLQRSRAKFNESAKRAAPEDIVSIEYQSPEIENNKIFEDRLVLGKGGFPEDFEKSIEGLKNGEKKTFIALFPKESVSKKTALGGAPNAEVVKKLAGKNVSFTVRMKKVEEMVLPEINNEFAKEIGNFENMEDLKKNIKKDLLSQKQKEEDGRIREEITQKLSEETKLEVPSRLIEKEKENLFSDFKYRITRNLKIPFNDYLLRTGKDEEEIKKSLEKEAEQRIKSSLIIGAIGKKERVEANEPEIIEAMNRFLQHIPENSREKLDRSAIKDYYKNIIYSEKVLKIIMSYVSNSSNHN